MSSVTLPQAVWNGASMRAAFEFASSLIHHHRDRINALNVFPVPDGDTGTNMALTMRGALDALDVLGPDATASDVAGRLAYGALMGARGNSGVILSQILRGFANGIGEAREVGGRDLAKALDGATETAYNAVMRPVEGTMLTVIREGAVAAKHASEHTPSMIDVLRAAHDGAQAALERTPDQLDILRQAGVVDAGGQGVVYILEAFMRSASGDTELPQDAHEVEIGSDMAFLDMVDETHGEDAFGYCTNFMVLGSGIDMERSRAELAAMGDSAVIVGDNTTLKVHIHTSDPAEVLAYALRLGELDQIKIDNMSLQTEALTTQRRESTAGPSRSAVSDEDRLHGNLAIIAVAAGTGISDALYSLGVTSIIEGGQTMNPSTQELLAAVEATTATEVIVLPNNPNIIMTANQVADLTSKTVRVVPSRSIPAALAALTAFNTDHSVEENVDDMIEAMGDTRGIAITRAIRDVEVNEITVGRGQVIGLVNDDLVAAGDAELDVVMRTFEAAEVEEPELLTIFVGEHVAEEEAETLASAIAGTWPDAEIEMHNGGQPHYRYIISAE